MVRQIRSKVVIAGAALAVVAALGAGVAAQGDGHGRRGGFGPGRGFPGMAALELTDTQREQVRDVMQRHGGEMKATGTQLHEAHAAQRAAVETVPVNEGLVRSTSQTLATAQTEMALLRARIHGEIWSLLTPEQQQKAKELKAKREARMQERRQQRRQQ
jgi:protein CpxP